MADLASHPRRLPWLMKSCLPKPSPEHRLAFPSPSRRAPPPPPISLLPDDLLLDILSRLPLSSLPSLPLVCRRFSHLLHSPSFLLLRRRHHHLRPSLLALSFPDPSLLLSISLFPSLPLSGVSIPAEIPVGSFSHARAVPIGRYIFLIGRAATLRFDSWTGSVVSRAPTIFPRKKFAAAAVAGRIYVAGGSSRTSAVEEYDPDRDCWRIVAESPRRRYGCVGAAAGGVFFVIGGLVFGRREARLDAHLWAGTMDAYEVETGAWARSRAAAAVPGGGCVVGACAAREQVYVLASHAVEVSFWRWETAAKERRGGGVWRRLAAPPMAGGMRIGGAMGFCCAAVGEEKIGALVHVSADGARRGHVAGLGTVEGTVLLYDIAAGEWSPGPDLPARFLRAVLACVEC